MSVKLLVQSPEKIQKLIVTKSNEKFRKIVSETLNKIKNNFDGF